MSTKKRTLSSSIGTTQKITSINITVIIPTLNEAGSISEVLQNIPEWIYEIIIVDGMSTDGTVEIARQIIPDIRVIYENKKGKGAALRTAYFAATGDIIVTIDGDGSIDPKEIASFIGALLSGADYVKGSRFLQGAGTFDMPLYRKIGNSVLVGIANILFGTKYTDITYGYNAFWRRHVPILALEIDGWPHEILNNIRVASNKLRVVEVACIEYDRIAGEAKLEAWSAGTKILFAIINEKIQQITNSYKNMIRVTAESGHISLVQTLYYEISMLHKALNNKKITPSEFLQSLDRAETAYLAMYQGTSVAQTKEWNVLLHLQNNYGRSLRKTVVQQLDIPIKATDTSLETK